MTDHWFEPVAEHLGSAYLRYSFTKGTDQEVDFLVAEVGLAPGQRVLDVGCGPGRHAHALAERGLEVHGVDISDRFVELAADGGGPATSFERADARALRFDEEFDAAYSLCQGAFGITGGPGADPDPVADDLAVLAGMARAVRPGGLVVVSAFSAAFGLTAMGAAEWDAATGVHAETTTIVDEEGQALEVQLWTTWYTARELRLLARCVGLDVEHVYAVTPGGYGRRAPTAELEELLLVARVPSTGTPG